MFCLPQDKFLIFSRSMQTKPIWLGGLIKASLPALTQDEIKKSMPNYIKALESVDAGAWGVGNYKGKNWGIPKVWPSGNSGFIPGYNEAWLKKIGYNEPPKTLAELEDVLTKFVNNDPDGNGKKDTYGMSGRGKLPIQMFTSVFSAYGVSPYQFKLDASGKSCIWRGNGRNPFST